MLKTNNKLETTFWVIKKFVHYLLVIILIGVIYIWISYPNSFKLFLFWIEKEINNYWNWNYLLVALCWVFESLPVIWVFVPWQNIIIIVWGFFWKHHMVWLIIVATISVYIGHLIWFTLWEKFWIKFIAQYWESVWFGKKEVEFMEKQIEKRWWTILILWTFYNMTRAFVPFIAWSMKMDKKKFAIYNFIWSFSWALAVIVVWVMFSSYYNLLIEKLPKLLLIAWVIFVIYYYLSKKFKLKKRFVDYEDKVIWKNK